MAAVISRELRDEVLAKARLNHDRVKAVATDLYLGRIRRMARRRGLSKKQAALFEERALRRVESLLSL